MKNQKFVTEIRFIPKPLFLDIRGQITTAMASEKFDQWKIDADRTEVFSDDGLIFASYKNIGFITLQDQNIELCIERMDEAIKIMGDLPPLRWGVRIYTIIPTQKKFTTLVSEYKKKLLNFNPKNFSKINGNLEDIGISYIFKNDKNKYHITTGPMEKKQASQIFPPNELPDIGIFIDLDIYRENDDFYRDDFRRARMISFIKDSFAKGKEIVEELTNTINDKK